MDTGQPLYTSKNDRDLSIDQQIKDWGSEFSHIEVILETIHSSYIVTMFRDAENWEDENDIVYLKMFINFILDMMEMLSGTFFRALQDPVEIGDGHASVRVGAAVTNLQLADWSKT